MKQEKWTKIAGTQCDLTSLNLGQRVAYGDGKTFYWLIEKEDDYKCDYKEENNMKCSIKYPHNFNAYPCRRCRGFLGYWKQIIINKIKIWNNS